MENKYRNLSKKYDRKSLIYFGTSLIGVFNSFNIVIDNSFNNFSARSTLCLLFSMGIAVYSVSHYLKYSYKYNYYNNKAYEEALKY